MNYLALVQTCRVRCVRVPCQCARDFERGFEEGELERGLGPSIIAIAFIGALAVAIALLDAAAANAALACCSNPLKKLGPRCLSVLRRNCAAYGILRIRPENNLDSRSGSTPRTKAILRCDLRDNILQSHNFAVLSELPVAKTLPFG